MFFLCVWKRSCKLTPNMGDIHYISLLSLTISHYIVLDFWIFCVICANISGWTWGPTGVKKVRTLSLLLLLWGFCSHLRAHGSAPIKLCLRFSEIIIKLLPFFSFSFPCNLHAWEQIFRIATSSSVAKFFQPNSFIISWWVARWKLFGNFRNFDFDLSCWNLNCSQLQKHIMQLSGKGCSRVEWTEIWDSWELVYYIWGTFDFCTVQGHHWVIPCTCLKMGFNSSESMYDIFHPKSLWLFLATVTQMLLLAILKLKI